MENPIVKSADCFEEQVIDYFYPSNTTPVGFILGWNEMRNIRIRPSELSVWAGINGHGKSMIVSQLALMAANAGEKTVIASFEMPAAKTLGRMVKQATGEINPSHDKIKECLSWMKKYIHIYDYVGRGTVNTMLDNFKIACNTKGCTQFIIDSLMKCGLAEDDYSKQKFLVEDFHNAAMQLLAHVHLVAHARKSKDEYDKPGKMDVSGSAGITNIADNVYTVWRNKPKEAKIHQLKRQGVCYIPHEVENQPDCIVECVKSREQGGEVEKQYYLWYNPYNCQYLNEDKLIFNYLPFIEDLPF